MNAVVKNKKIDFSEALNKAKRACGYKEMCVYDIKMKLVKWHTDRNDKEKIIKILKNEDFINEVRYAKAFVKDKFKFNKWGKIKINYFLRSKNLPDNIIENALKSEIDPDEYYELIKDAIKSKIKDINEEDKYNLKSKLLRFAESRGYEHDISNKAIMELIKV